MSASVGEHARVQPGTMINGRFAVVREMGCGNFAKVYCCRDTQRPASGSPEMVAVKVLKREYANDARYEASVLKVVTDKNPNDRHSVLTMREQMNWGRYPVFVFPLKGPTLRQCKLGITRGCVSSSDVRHFAFEMLQALSFLHFDAKIIHTDLKPENILLEQSDAVAGAGIGAKWTIADFGSASFYRPEKLDNDLISTRPYRSPEVVLGSSWYYPADTWSMACIIYEVYAGQRLFDVHDDVTHLWQMERRLGPLPCCLTSGLRYSRRYFDDDGRLQGRAPVAATSTIRPLCDVLKDEPLLLDLLTGLLAFDPKQRLRADKALEHPYFDGMNTNAAARHTSPRMSLPLERPTVNVTPLPKAPLLSPTAAAADLPITVAAPTQHRPLPITRAASPMLPMVTTNSYEVLKNTKYRRGLMCPVSAAVDTPSTVAVPSPPPAFAHR